MKLQSILPEFFQKTTGFDVQFVAFLALLTFTSKKISLLANPQSFSNFFLLAISFAVPSLKQANTKPSLSYCRLHNDLLLPLVTFVLPKADGCQLNYGNDLFSVPKFI